MLVKIVITIIFLVLGILGIVYSKKIADAHVSGHAHLYGQVISKRVKKSIIKSKLSYNFFQIIIIAMSLSLFLISFMIIKESFI